MFSKLVEQGLPRERLRLFENDPAASDTASNEGSNAVLKDVLVAETLTEQETAIAREIIQASVGDHKVSNIA